MERGTTSEHEPVCLRIDRAILEWGPEKAQQVMSSESVQLKLSETKTTIKTWQVRKALP